MIENFKPGTSLYEIINPLNTTVIRFENYQLHTLPRLLFHYNPEIIELDIKNSSLRHISKIAFQNGQSLINLDLTHNKIEMIPGSTFKYASNLQKLSLSHNHIEVLDHGAFKYLANLFYLALDNNNIKYISKDAFEGLRSLKALLLHSNQIKTISSNLKPLIVLENLTLHDNKLHYLRIKIMNRTLANLHILTLRGNPWFCPGLKLMKNYLNASLITSDIKKEVDGSEAPCVETEDVLYEMTEKEIKEIQKLSGPIQLLNPTYDGLF